MSWILIICHTMTWGLCSYQIRGGMFDTYENCARAVADVRGTNELIYCRKPTQEEIDAFVSSTKPPEAK